MRRQRSGESELNRDLNLELSGHKNSKIELSAIQGKRLGQKMLLTVSLWFPSANHRGLAILTKLRDFYVEIHAVIKLLS